MARSNNTIEDHREDIIEGLYEIAEDSEFSASARVAAFARLSSMFGLEKDPEPNDEEKVVYKSLADFYAAAKG